MAKDIGATPATALVQREVEGQPCELLPCEEPSAGVGFSYPRLGPEPRGIHQLWCQSRIHDKALKVHRFVMHTSLSHAGCSCPGTEERAALGNDQSTAAGPNGRSPDYRHRPAALAIAARPESDRPRPPVSSPVAVPTVGVGKMSRPPEPPAHRPWPPPRRSGRFPPRLPYSPPTQRSTIQLPASSRQAVSMQRARITYGSDQTCGPRKRFCPLQRGLGNLRIAGPSSGQLTRGSSASTPRPRDRSPNRVPRSDPERRPP